jgi:hypothetical protein
MRGFAQHSMKDNWRLAVGDSRASCRIGLRREFWRNLESGGAGICIVLAGDGGIELSLRNGSRGQGALRTMRN